MVKPLRRLDGEDAALTGEAAAHARAGLRGGAVEQAVRSLPAAHARGVMPAARASRKGGPPQAGKARRRRVRP